MARGMIFPVPATAVQFSRRPEEDNTMTDRLINIDNLCTNPDNHAMHLCELTTAGKTAVIDEMTKNPTFICGNCGMKANTEGALCAPGPFHD